MHSITTDNSSIKSTKQVISFIELAARLGVDFALVRNKSKTNLHLSFKDEGFETCEKNLKEMENSISSEKTTNDEKVFVEKPICEISKKILQIRDDCKRSRRKFNPVQSIIDKTYDVDAVKKLISLRKKGNINEKEISAQSELLGVENFIEAGISNKEILLFLRIATNAIGKKSTFIDLFRYVKDKYYLPICNVQQQGGDYCQTYQLFAKVGRTIFGTSLETKFLEGEEIDLNVSPSTLYRKLWCNQSSKNKESFPR